MMVLHDGDGNSIPLADRDGFVARVLAAVPTQWLSESGQIGLECRSSTGSDWLYFSLVEAGRFLVFSQRSSAERIFAVTPQGASDPVYTFLLGGREMTIAEHALISSQEAADAAAYFISQNGLLTPLVHWQKNGQPYWPDFE